MVPGTVDARPGIYVRALAAWVALVVGHPITVLLLTLGLTVVSVVHSSKTVRMNSDDSALISREEPFRRDYQDYVDAFPEMDDTTVIVITSPSLDQANDAAERLSRALARATDLVATVNAPSTEPFFEDHALLYLDEADLGTLVERLAEAQPVLAALAADPSVRGLFGQLEDALEQLESDTDPPTGLARIARLVSETIESTLAGSPRAISWTDELMEHDGDVYRVISVQGRKHFDETIASARLIDGIRRLAGGLHLTPEHGVRVRLTGMVPLAYEEQESVQRGLSIAVTISLTLLALILGFGVRSVRIISATAVTLLASLSWTTSFAMLTVGEFNIVSAAFAVLLIGLGVDFAVHIGLRYEEESRSGRPVRQALPRAAAQVGGAVSLCALTSAIGFLSFVPTRYHALADLGIIAGGGMLLSAVASFTVFPACLALMRRPTPRPWAWSISPQRLDALLTRQARAVVATSAVIAVIASVLAVRMDFDFSTLGMKDPTSESMTTLRELHDEDIATDYSAIVLAPDLASSAALARRLSELDVVSEVRDPATYVPDAQDAKLALLDEAAFFLEPALSPIAVSDPPTDDERLAALERLRRRIHDLPDGDAHDATHEALRRLGAALDAVSAGPAPRETTARLERHVISDVEERLDWLRRALAVGAVEFSDLPESVRRTVVDARGRVRIVALPRDDMRDPEALAHFVSSVAAVAPRVTGRPAVEAGIGDLVVRTFRVAIAIAFVAITLVLLLTLRNPTDAVLVLVPITLAALLTVAAGVVIGMPFNMSNVVVVPLILGLGVDTAIHVVVRFRENGSLAAVLESSTPRAVLLSALTTLAAFSSLSVSGHVGLRSLGVLLSISVISLIVSTLLVLPAMMVLRKTRRRSPVDAA